MGSTGTAFDFNALAAPAPTASSHRAREVREVDGVSASRSIAASRSARMSGMPRSVVDDVGVGVDFVFGTAECGTAQRVAVDRTDVRHPTYGVAIRLRTLRQQASRRCSGEAVLLAVEDDALDQA